MHTSANWLQALVLLIGFCRFVFSMYFQFQWSCFYLKFLFIKCIKFSAEDQCFSLNKFILLLYLYFQHIVFESAEKQKHLPALGFSSSDWLQWRLSRPMHFSHLAFTATKTATKSKKWVLKKTTKSATRSTNWVFKNNKKCN